MTPWAGESIFTTTTPNQIVPVPVPGRCTIERIQVVRIGGGTITLNFYSRAFVGPTQNILRIVNDGNGFTQLVFFKPFAVKVGDVIAVASSPTAGYNTSHRVTDVIDAFNIVTDQSFTAAAYGGTANIDIPTAEQPLYNISDTITGTNNASDLPDYEYVNQDPVNPIANTGTPRLIYVEFGDAGTYKLSIYTQEGIAVG